jgi:streptogramin lyase
MVRQMIFLMAGLVLAVRVVKVEGSQADVSDRQATTESESVRPNEIGGAVSGPNGPEAGVWVIAETSGLPTKLRKIVVTDDKGRFLVPDLPKANYKVWVRGYGLVDSSPVEAALGNTLALAAVRAPDARSAAQIYPANYWFSLVHIPPESAFPPMKPESASTAKLGQSQGGQTLVVGGIRNQAEWVYAMRICTQCHQLGDAATREIEPSLGTFDSTVAAWDRRLRSGQRGPFMEMALNQFPRQRALAMFADWTDRIAAGEVAPAPPRPQGVERNVVLTEWDWGKGSADWIHDEISTDKREPTLNRHGLVYATASGSGSLAIADPHTNEASEVKVPARDDPKSFQTYLMSAEVDEPSPYFGNQIMWIDRTTPHNLMMDQRGRLWVTSAIRSKANPAFCKEGSSNLYAKNYPLTGSERQLSLYDPETKKWTLIDTCFTTHHLQFAKDKDNTLYFSGQDGAVGWVNTRVFEQTRDEQAAQGWCPAYFDSKGDGKFDPKVDKTIIGFPYGIAVNPVDRSVWYAAVGIPGKIVRIDHGSNPPATCRTEVYEPPYENPKAPGKTGFLPHGIDVDQRGVVWTSLAGSGHLASFDRRKCTVRSGPAATGQQCPEGWTLYQLPGPLLSGTNVGSADYAYYDWVDQFDTLGLGKNVPIATGTNSDSLLALDPKTGRWVVLRVPYPLGFYARGLDGRIDDPKGGWKGHGLWSSYSPIPVWHIEGGKEATSMLVHFQLRPNPLAH